MYRKSKRNQTKIGLLLKQERKLFHTNDLAVIWDVANKNTLYTTIKRYVERGILMPIHKGFYAVIELAKINPVELAVSYLHQYAYLSTESVLVEGGIISQDIPHITLVSGVSKRFQLADNAYLVRQMQPRFLYQNRGIIQEKSYKKATIERAVADLLYFNPRYHLDGRRLVDWDKVGFIQKEVGFK